MNDNLQNALAGLADQLGVTTAQLWDWMQGYGIGAYAKATIAAAIPALIFTVVVAVTITVLSIMFYRKYKEDFDSEPEFMFLCAAVPLILLLFDGMFIVSIAGTILGWLASPEGMVLRMLAERF